MTVKASEAAKTAIEFFSTELDKLGASPMQHDRGEIFETQKQCLDHCAFMLTEMAGFVEAGRFDKFMR